MARQPSKRSSARDAPTEMLSARSEGLTERSGRGADRDGPQELRRLMLQHSWASGSIPARAPIEELQARRVEASDSTD